MPRKKKSRKAMSTMNVGFSEKQNNLPEVLNRLREKVDRTNSITTETDGENNNAYNDFLQAIDGTTIDNIEQVDLSTLGGDTAQWFSDFEDSLT